MRFIPSRLLAIAIASAALIGTASGQPEPREHRGPKDAPRRRPPPPPPPTPDTAGPTEAPPAPREEKIETKAGFVWVRGRWEWKAGKYEWIAGHWERERAGKRWNEGRWERKGP